MEAVKEGTKIWDFAKDFDRGNVVVRVTKLVQERPRYSIQLLRRCNDGKMQRHFGVFVTFGDGSPTLKESIANTVASLIAEAESWIESQVREFEANRRENNA